MPQLSNRNGFALPLAILVLAVLTAALAAGFMATNAEIATNTAERGVLRAYAIAQNGLEQFLVRRAETNWCQHCILSGAGAPPNADSEWTRVTTTMGYADVMARRVHVPAAPTDAAIYFISSIGTDTTTHMSGLASSVNAQRMVGLYASWPPPMSALAAWEGLAGISDTLNTVTISGVDGCNGGLDTIAGVTTPDSTWVQHTSFTPIGKPPYDTTKSLAQVEAETHIDWAGIMGGSITPTVSIPPSSWPATSLFSDSTAPWPIIRVHTNGYTLPAVTKEFGLIICDSDCYNLTNQWRGAILVGGALTEDQGNSITGAAVTGLNVLIGGHPKKSFLNAKSNAFYYNSCEVAKATARLQVNASYSPFSNTWMDNIAIY